LSLEGFILDISKNITFIRLYKVKIKIDTLIRRNNPKEIIVLLIEKVAILPYSAKVVAVTHSLQNIISAEFLFELARTKLSLFIYLIDNRITEILARNNIV